MSVRVLPDGSVTATDQWTGIPPEDRQRIFQRFWRGKGVSTSGAGLGLAIVKEIVAAHHGTIQIDPSPPGKGTAFTLRFSPWVSTLTQLLTRTHEHVETSELQTRRTLRVILQQELQSQGPPLLLASEEEGLWHSPLRSKSKISVSTCTS